MPVELIDKIKTCQSINPRTSLILSRLGSELVLLIALKPIMSKNKTVTKLITIYANLSPMVYSSICDFFHRKVKAALSS